jgi:hypothetical protein
MHNVMCENKLDPQELSFAYKATQQKTRVFFREMCKGNNGPPYHTAVTIGGASFVPTMRSGNRDPSFEEFTGLQDVTVSMSTCGKKLPTATYRLPANMLTSDKDSSPMYVFNETSVDNEDGTKSRVFSYHLEKVGLHSDGRMGVMINAKLNVTVTDYDDVIETNTSINKTGIFPYHIATAKYTHSIRNDQTSKITVKGHITLLFSDSDLPMISFWLNDDTTITSSVEDVAGEVDFLARPLVSPRNGLVEIVSLHQLKKEGFMPMFDDKLVNIDE